MIPQDFHFPGSDSSSSTGEGRPFSGNFNLINDQDPTLNQPTIFDEDDSEFKENQTEWISRGRETEQVKTIQHNEGTVCITIS